MESADYLQFKEDSIDHLCELQEEFKRLFPIDSSTEWYYDDGLGVFTLKSDSHVLYFKYVKVGSYSQNSNTWKWSWDNDHTYETVKRGMEKVKLFGEEKNYHELTTGLIKEEREIGWEMTAIANQFINGFGAYRVTSDHLDLYFLFIKEVDSESYKKLKEKYVECGEHGSRRIAFVCQHLNLETKTGFEEAFPTHKGMELGEDDDFQSWCDECEKVRLKEDGWDEETMKFAKIKLVCENCYFELKDFNLGEKK